MKTEIKVSRQAVGLAQDTLDQARREVDDDAAPARAIRLGWEARFRDVSAGRHSSAALWLEALAALGDKGARHGLEVGAQLAAEAEQDEAVSA